MCTKVHTWHNIKTIIDRPFLCGKCVTMVQVVGFGYGDMVQKESHQSELRFRRYGQLKFEFKPE